MTSSCSGSGQPMSHPSGSWHGPSTRLAAIWRALMQRWALARRARQDMQVLSALDDRQLRDIGLVRGDIGSAIAGSARQSRATPRPLHRSRLGPAPLTASTPASRSAS